MYVFVDSLPGEAEVLLIVIHGFSTVVC
jgi:hypothetical protein